MLRKFWKKYLGLILGILEKEKKKFIVKDMQKILLIQMVRRTFY